MNLPKPDPSGRHHFPDGSFVWQSRSGNGWCASTVTDAICDAEGVPVYFGSAASAASALGFTITDDGAEVMR